jgi:hypothetical protein
MNEPTDQPTQDIQQDGTIAPAPPTFEEWFGRVEKTAQMQGATIPLPGPAWELLHAEGMTPVEAFNASVGIK